MLAWRSISAVGVTSTVYENSCTYYVTSTLQGEGNQEDT